MANIREIFFQGIRNNKKIQELQQLHKTSSTHTQNQIATLKQENITLLQELKQYFTLLRTNAYKVYVNSIDYIVANKLKAIKYQNKNAQINQNEATYDIGFSNKKDNFKVGRFRLPIQTEDNDFLLEYHLKRQNRNLYYDIFEILYCNKVYTNNEFECLWGIIKKVAEGNYNEHIHTPSRKNLTEKEKICLNHLTKSLNKDDTNGLSL